MKIQALLVAFMTTMVIADQYPGAEKICGRLGPMTWDPKDFPDDFDFSQIRMCADHPQGAGNYWGFGDYLPSWVPRNPLADIRW
ncbi:gpi anchored glyco [Fusarium longipes]|uniref:Gpi anchored glyco n=1 Tax=Fusarium longipes TaxID=694270 RepID=A0A395T043_9HYPO|nr:gpi anchored glyco [Fusarium longipes]